MMNGAGPKVLYIAGWDRSGSTILDQILGQLPGFFSVGEVVDLWDRGPKALCGCGHIFEDCSIWRQIFLEAFGETPDRFDFRACEGYRRRCARLRHSLLLSNPLLRRLLASSLEPYLQLTEKVYRAVGSVTGARVIVDSSKQPTHAYVLALAGVAGLHVIHLVRDPRGCAYSYQIGKVHPDPRIARMPLIGPAKSSLHWILANAATEALWCAANKQYLLVRYEDFMRWPKESLIRIIDFVGETVSEFPFLSEHSVSLQPVHGVSGNPARFRTGTVELKRDENWKTAMKRSHKLAVTALTSLALPRYRYSYRLHQQ
jgi:hypothetical protein